MFFAIFYILADQVYRNFGANVATKRDVRIGEELGAKMDSQFGTKIKATTLREKWRENRCENPHGNWHDNGNENWTHTKQTIFSSAPLDLIISFKQ